MGWVRCRDIFSGKVVYDSRVQADADHKLEYFRSMKKLSYWNHDRDHHGESYAEAVDLHNQITENLDREIQGEKR